MSVKKRDSVYRSSLFHDRYPDRVIYFDTDRSFLKPVRGEFIISVIDDVEDTKGNPGVTGSLTITNLRLIWVGTGRAASNLSIGYENTQKLSIHTSRNKLHGTTKALFVLCSYNKRHFEFTFTHLRRNDPLLFQASQAVFRAYDSSRLFRRTRLRGSAVQAGHLVILPGEEMISTFSHISNLTNTGGGSTPGTLYMTTVRLVWCSRSSDAFNVSVPYLDIASCGLRTVSIHKNALVVATHPRKTSTFRLGFTGDAVKEVTEELHRLAELTRARPDFGVAVAAEEEEVVEEVEDVQEDPDDSAALRIARQTAMQDRVFAYATEGGDDDRPITYNEELGLAFEQVKEGFELKDLWECW